MDSGRLREHLLAILLADDEQIRQVRDKLSQELQLRARRATRREVVAESKMLRKERKTSCSHDFEKVELGRGQSISICVLCGLRA